ncbi:hypothetical protein [Pontibacter sp. Tf4]|nr:hypothetical protein [Pontibacter sp. Tf4]
MFCTRSARCCVYFRGTGYSCVAVTITITIAVTIKQTIARLFA